MSNIPAIQRYFRRARVELENIANGSLVRGGHTECLLASLPKLCPSLGEALIVIDCAAHRADLSLLIL